MKCLLVKAHPLAESLCSSTARRIIEVLGSMGHEITVSDLYEEHFDAAMTASERDSYYKETYHTAGVADQIERLQSAEAIVLVFPTWWFGMPAILKGWFDRVWAPGEAYDHAPGYGPIRPRLQNLREMLVVTSLGAPWWIDFFIMRRPVRRILKTAIAGTCAPGCRFRMVSIYKSESLTSKRVSRFFSRIEDALSRWPGKKNQPHAQAVHSSHTAGTTRRTET